MLVTGGSLLRATRQPLPLRRWPRAAATAMQPCCGCTPPGLVHFCLQRWFFLFSAISYYCSSESFRLCHYCVECCSLTLQILTVGVMVLRNAGPLGMSCFARWRCCCSALTKRAAVGWAAMSARAPFSVLSVDSRCQASYVAHVLQVWQQQQRTAPRAGNPRRQNRHRSGPRSGKRWKQFTGRPPASRRRRGRCCRCHCRPRRPRCCACSQR